MTIEQVEKRINDLCEQEPDNAVGIRYLVGYRDALASKNNELQRWQEMYKAAAAERDANMKRLIELEKKLKEGK